MKTHHPLSFLFATVAFAGLIGQSHAVVVHTADFEAGLPAGYSGAGSIASSEGYSAYGFGTRYLRNDTDNGAGSGPAGITALTLGSLPAHGSLNLTFDLAIIDSWDGSTTAGGTVPPDFFNVRIDGVTVFSFTFDNFLVGDQTYTGASLVYGAQLAVTGGSVGPNWPDSAYNISLTIPHSAAGLSVEWFASGQGWQAFGDESWAVDNVQVSVPDGGSTLALMGLSLTAMGVLRIKKSRKQQRA